MNFFFHQLSRSIGVFFRTIRAFFSRKIMGITSMLRRLTNFSRHATKVASSSLQGVVSAAQKPTSQSDYVETGQLYISKALIIRILLVLVALALIGYFIVWPFVLSRFLTAKFYEQDKRVANWSGRVIVYSDAKKTLPLYAGRLEDGVLQGEAKQYDRDGILLYEGQLRDGQRSGSGREYENGILSYEGQFEAGLYSGRGKRYTDGEMVYDGQYAEGMRSGSGTAYQGGKRLYEGQFAEDLYEGRGKLYQDGTLCYDGTFHAGVAEGTGTAYYPSGKVAYQGQYLADKPDGTGTAYDESGRKVYAGGFAEGEYSGQGTLYFTDGSQIEAGFEKGEPAGNVDWKKDGILYYQGGWQDEAPSGFGALYSKTGKKLYEGPFLGGTIDGRSLLDYSTDELRAAFGDGSMKNESDGTGFRIIAEELGVAALCTFQTETAPSQVYQIYLSRPEKGDWIALLPGMDHTQPVQWPDDDRPDQITIQYVRQLGVNVAAGPYFADNLVKSARRTTALYTNDQREKAVLVTWERRDVTPDPVTVGNGGAKSGKVEKLLSAMDKMIEADGTAASAGAKFGGKLTDDALAEMEDLEQAASAVDAMIDFWEQSQQMSALEEINDRREVLLADARSALAKGVGTREQVEAMEQTQMELQARIDACKTAIKRAELQAEAAGVEGLKDYALEDMIISFDPADQDVRDLALLAAAYAQATGGEMDAAAAENAVKEGLLNLADAHSAAKLALARCQTLAENTKSAAGAYSMGLGSKETWYEAINAEAMARIDLCSALADFSREANRFNQLTGGWVSRTFDWHQDIFGELFLKEIPPEGASDGETSEDAGSGTDGGSEDDEPIPASPTDIPA